jgi:hypothetical protein
MDFFNFKVFFALFFQSWHRFPTLVNYFSSFCREAQSFYSLFVHKKPPRLPVTETGAVHYALFVLSQALTQNLAGVLDRSLSGC